MKAACLLVHAGSSDAALNTELELSAVDEEIDYHFQGKDSQSISFNLKDFKVRTSASLFCRPVSNPRLFVWAAAMN
jgi:hypothetical protein